MTWPTALVLVAALAACALEDASPQPPAAFPGPGRPVAAIVSPSWSDEAQRDRLREFEQVAREARIGPGMTVADIGAGSGYYTVRLSPLVGPQGRVLAEDIIPQYLAQLDARVKSQNLANLTLIEGTPDDPRLPAGSVDVALMIHMYHEVEQPYALLHRLAGALKPGGRVVVVDQPWAPPQHGIPPDVLRCEMAAVGYRQESLRTLDNEDAFVAVFTLPNGPVAPTVEATAACRRAR